MNDRDQVYAAINQERDYQDKLPATRTDGKQRSVGDYCTMMTYYAGQLVAAWTENPGDTQAMAVMRKIAGIAVRAMEEHGIVWRGEQTPASDAGEAGTGDTRAAQEPVAWAVTIGPPHDLSVYEAFAEHQKDEAVSLARECLFGQTDRPLPLAPLYFAPTPTAHGERCDAFMLTDAEREAIKRAAEDYAEAQTLNPQLKKECNEVSATLRGLLARASPLI
jgi:hypothetical protein